MDRLNKKMAATSEANYRVEGIRFYSSIGINSDS